MARNIEIEAKSMINEEDYNLLLNDLVNEYPSYEQVNYLIHPIYLPLSDKSVACRMRVKPNVIEFTLKINLDEGKLEINQDLSKEEINNFLNNHIVPKGEIYDECLKRNLCNPEDLRVFATLKTTRIDIQEEDYLISIDKNEYLGRVDYEVECESSSMEKAEKYLKEFLNKKNIPFKRNTNSKLKRVKNALI